MEPSAVAPGQTPFSGVFVVFDPALPRSVLCLVTASILVISLIHYGAGNKSGVRMVLTVDSPVFTNASPPHLDESIKFDDVMTAVELLSLCNLCVSVVNYSQQVATETQSTQRLHREEGIAWRFRVELSKNTGNHSSLH